MRRLLSVLCLCALSACASSGGSTAASSTSASTKPADSTTAPGDTSSAATTAPADAATTTPAVAPGNVDPCAIITTADVAAAFGGTVAAGVANPDNGGCDYELTGKTNTGDSGILAQVSINLNGEYETYAREKVIFPDVEKVDGLGSEAWYYALASQLHINLGTKELLISGVLPGDKAAVKAEVIAFAKVVVGKL